MNGHDFICRAKILYDYIYSSVVGMHTVLSPPHLLVVLASGQVEGDDAGRDEGDAEVVPQGVLLLGKEHPEQHHRDHLERMRVVRVREGERARVRGGGGGIGGMISLDRLDKSSR